ncbi:glycosyltransferase family 4 protein [Microbacterium terrisoli]|uniref:glycosyltransferase family 4 protein n=1 Tax=Microbacterium terrisoli TaxID=3242192 RepID=UPI00280512D7|nr:glycosyltransferase family 4 protein [Microbacterium protaetiae]
MTPLSILHAIRSDRFAGVEQLVLRLAVAQAAAGHRVRVVGGASERMADPLRAAGVVYVPASHTRHVVAALRRWAGTADVVNTHMTAADVAAVFAFFGRARPAVASTRHFAQRRGRLRALPLDPVVRRVVDVEIAVSHAVAAAVGVPSTVVHSGIAPVPFADPGSRRRVVLIAQRLQPEKQTLLAVDAFARSGLVSDGWCLEVAGDGADYAAVASGVERLGDAGRMLGFRDDVPELMACAGILLAPTPNEALGLSVIEAMACGLPVVAAGAAGHLDVMAGLDPRALFAPGDAAGAARALRALADDPEGRRRLGTAERERQQRDFSLDQQVAGTDAAYRAAITRHRAGDIHD